MIKKGTCRYGCSPCEPVFVGGVGVVEPKLIFGSRQAPRELYHMSDVLRCNGCVRLGATVWRPVVETVRRVVLAQILRDLDH